MTRELLGQLLKVSKIDLPLTQRRNRVLVKATQIQAEQPGQSTNNSSHPSVRQATDGGKAATESGSQKGHDSAVARI
jgi:hypothetical protein